MNAIELEVYINQIQGLLDKHESFPERPYWIIDDDTCADYCIDCIKSVIVTDDEYGELYDGGFSCEDDGSRHCEQCGKLLQYMLTDYGVNYELEYFSGMSFDWNNSDLCYQMGRIAYGAYTARQKREIVKIIKKSLNQPTIEYH